jgi:starch synthase
MNILKEHFADEEESCTQTMMSVLFSLQKELLRPWKIDWVPDIIHVHGWMAAMLPIYMKHYYKNEALFSDTKIVTSVYSQSFWGSLDAWLIKSNWTEFL